MVTEDDPFPKDPGTGPRMRRSLVVAAALALPLSLLTVSPAAAVDYDCTDFTWQEDAQAV